MKNKPLLNSIKKLNRRDKKRLHMPGAKGKKLGFLNGIFKVEFTEIKGLDNLYHPQEAIKKMQDNYAHCIGAKDISFLVNGSTCGIVGILSMFKGKKIIFARDFHVSAAGVISTFDIDPVYVYPNMIDALGIVGTVSTKDMKSTIEQNQDAAAIYLTYPNYYGFCLDVHAICQMAHEANIPVIVDAAHAACFYLTDKLPQQPSLADVYVVSLHKNLPALNQTAYIATSEHSMLDMKDIKVAINKFQTTSPSYVLLASIEFAITYFVKKRRIKRTNKLIKFIHKISDKFDKLHCFHIIKSKEYHKDPLKLVVDYTHSSLDKQTIECICNRKKIYFEMIDTRFILFMLSPVNKKVDIRAIYRLLKKLNRKSEFVHKQSFYPNQLFDTQKGEKSQKTIYLDIAHCEGKVCAAPIAVYPPGVPILLDGDVVDNQIIYYILEVQREGLSTVGIVDNQILVYSEDV